MFKFVHCADLHLDSPLRGLSAKPDAPEADIRSATRRALLNLVELCVEESAAFVVIAGDVYDGDWEDYSTGLFFNGCMARLREHNIQVYLIRGNHDAANHMTSRLTLPDNVIEFPANKPKTEYIPSLGVAIHGQGFVKRAVTDNLAAHYPPAEPGYFNIGVLHTSVEGREGHESYAPCSLDDLLYKGYQYWALGHIHKREVLHEDPYIVFPGNLQGRHIRETGEKGCTLVSVDGPTVQLEHRNLDVLRWQVCSVDLSDARSEADFTSAVYSQMERLIDANPGYPLALRVHLTGQTILHGRLLDERETFLREVQNAAGIVAGGRIWIEKVRFATQPLSDWSMGADRTDALTALQRSIASAAQDLDFLESFLGQVKGVQSKMRAYAQMPDSTRVETEIDLLPLLKDAEEILLASLLKGGGAP